MITLDSYLFKLHQSGIQRLSAHIPRRDKKILESLAKQIATGNFLTQNQGKLLIKIFTENKPYLENTVLNFDQMMEASLWSESFRVVEHVRKIFISKDQPGYFTIEFTYNKVIKNKISDIREKIEGQVTSDNKRVFIPLTEKNIFLLVNELQGMNFNISDEIMKFYREISKIIDDKKDYFNISTTENKKLIAAVTKEIGNISADNSLLLHDRKFRFQFTTDFEISSNTLSEKIANRKDTKIFIDSTTYSLSEIFDSLNELDRLPVMLVFNGHDAEECLSILDILSPIIEKHQLKNKTGIYFRFDNNDNQNKQFNERINELKFNSLLTEETRVIGISNGKLPKFMLKTPWYPKTVISFTNSFKGNKTAIYADGVDLVIFYNKKEPLGASVYAIV